LTRDRWLFLFAAIGAFCALATYLKLDVHTLSSFFAAPPNSTASFSSRDEIIIFFIFASFCLSGLGFYLSKGDSVSRLTRNQKRLLLRGAAQMRTLIRRILIAYTDGNSATEAFARSLGMVFNQAGIGPWFVHARPDSPAQFGVMLCVKDLNNPPQATEHFKSILKQANISFTVSGFPKSGFSGIDQSNHVEDDKNLVIWVAPNPL
jgi:hypothetical protein